MSNHNLLYDNIGFKHPPFYNGTVMGYRIIVNHCQLKLTHKQNAQTRSNILAQRRNFIWENTERRPSQKRGALKTMLDLNTTVLV